MSLRDKPLPEWTDEELASELRFPVRFKDNPTGMYERILCEAVARLLLKKPGRG